MSRSANDLDIPLLNAWNHVLRKTAAPGSKVTRSSPPIGSLKPGLAPEDIRPSRIHRELRLPNVWVAFGSFADVTGLPAKSALPRRADIEAVSQQVGFGPAAAPALRDQWSANACLTRHNGGRARR